MLKPQLLQHWIDHFYGYGSWQAKFWFIGFEEGGGEVPEEVADKLNYFQTNHPGSHAALCDIRELYKQVTVRWDGPKASTYETLYDYRFGNSATLHGLWKNLVAFTHGYNLSQVPDLLAYQQHHFLSGSSNEALIQLYPLPSPHNHAWYYSWLDLPGLAFIRNRAVYQEHLYPQRISTILSNIKTYNPEVVLMYGMENINAIKKSIQESFHSVKFQMIKATKQKIPQYHHADINGTKILVTTQVPTLRHNRVETGFDWEELGRRIRTE